LLPYNAYTCSMNVTMLLLLVLLLAAIVVPRAASAYSLQGKRTLVTGSSGGIGRGIAKRLASEGAHIYVHYNTRHEGALETRDAIREAGGVCLGVVKCDFREDANIRQLFEKLSTANPIDVLVNNAGVVTKMAVDDDDDSLSIWKETLQVNLHAPLLLSKLAKKQMSGGGVIINVSSIHGERSNEYMGAYAASKAGLDSLTRTLALEWADDNIRVNAIAPGVVPVERTAEAFQDPTVAQGWIDYLPLKEWGTVDQVADAVVPLITNDWLTGAVWTIDGGMMARANMPNRAKPERPTQTTSSVDSEVTIED